MGIDVYVFDFLLGFAGRGLGDALCLGRQELNLARDSEQWNIAQALLSDYDPGRQLDELISSDGYAEALLAYLGCRSTRSVDYSPLEGAQIVCDLNQPIPEGLGERFDLIFDGGTLEHVFDIPMALCNIKRMLRPGGLFLSVNAANNQLGHGLYQFSPELFWRAFSRETGFSSVQIRLVPLSGKPAPRYLTDAGGRRHQFEPTPTATYLMVSARRSLVLPLRDTPVYQSDYVVSLGINSTLVRSCATCVGGGSSGRDNLDPPETEFSIRTSLHQPVPINSSEQAGITRKTVPNRKLIMMQTADPFVYGPLLDLSSRTNIEYCRRKDFGYESYVGIKSGVVPWMASYNRIFMLDELVQRGHRSWVIFADADAFVVELNFDIEYYLSVNDEYCLIGVTGGSAAPWNINSGILFINLGDPIGRAFVADWLERFESEVPSDYLASPSSQWDDYPNDQSLMYECIKNVPGLMSKTKQEDETVFNYHSGQFMRQAIRAGHPDLDARIAWVREQTDAVLAGSGLPV